MNIQWTGGFLWYTIHDTLNEQLYLLKKNLKMVGAAILQLNILKMSVDACSYMREMRKVEQVTNCTTVPCFWSFKPKYFK